LLRSEVDGSYYVGWTTDIVRRLVEHNQGLSVFTKRKRPWQLVGLESYPTPAAAKAYERALKHRPRMLQLFKQRILNLAAYGGRRQVVG
jgi:putative endonuclease